jgi:hypothetical protein
MADLSADLEVTTQGNGELFTAVIADAVTLYHGCLVGIEGGYANHWADGANDVLGGILVGGETTLVSDAEALLGDITPATGRTAPRVRIEEGAILTGLDGVLNASDGALTIANVGDIVYCPSSNVADMTLNSSGHTHPVGFVDDFRSATDVDVKLFTRAEQLAQITA